MKHLLTTAIEFLVIVFVISMTYPLWAAPDHYAIAIAPGIPPVEREKIWAQLEGFLLKTTMPHARIDFYQAAPVTPLASVNVSIGSTRARVLGYAGRLGAVKSFLIPPRGSQPAKGTGLHLPSLLSFLATQGRRPGEALTVILVGDFRILDAEAAHDLVSAWPSDGHLSAPAQNSLLSIADRKRQLEGITVHIAPLPATWAVNEAHRNGVTRFLTLWIGGQGGVLASLADLTTCFERASADIKRPFLEAAPDPQDQEITWRRRSFERVAGAAAPPVVQTETASVARTVDPIAAVFQTMIPTPSPGKTLVAVVWDGRIGCDLDLYIGLAGAPEVSFRRGASPGVKYFRDVRSPVAPAARQDARGAWEAVEIDGTDLSQVTAWLNMYHKEPDGQPLVGTLRIQQGERMVNIPITFITPDGGGNRGADHDPAARKTSPFWWQLDLQKMFLGK